uniref:Polyadenylate-binding protein 2-like n=1 Tax=Ciona intestinalis TaxID=7719 RepID=F6UTK0_CIOIN|nr:polyadenylate-binding protein 2-like [Ciona intestinalis]|eukprot:XP_002131910.1 polyadenylate-binding protein 2-like [Ciona intestinalis]
MADIIDNDNDNSIDVFATSVSNDGDLTVGDDSAVLDQSNGAADETDPELEAIKARVKEMEAEAEKLKEMQNDVEKQMTLSPPASATFAFPTIEEKVEADSRSVFVGNVDYGATAEELEQHFHGTGSINRVTILCDRYSGHPKGFAYVEFADTESVETATALDGTLFRGRQLQVNPKRTNKHGISSSDRGRPRYRGRGRGRHYAPYYGRPRRAFRGRPRGSWYSPY